MASENPELSGRFQDAQANLASSTVNRTRIDARTVGYPSTYDDKDVEWWGMTPVPGKSDQWRVITVREELNEHLAQISKNERLVKVIKTSAEPMSFDQAVERLAVWEMARRSKGSVPVEDHTAADIGRHNFRDIAMRRGYLISTLGKLCPVTNILPAEEGTFLKSDLEALQAYREGLKGDNILDELLAGYEPLHLSTEDALADDIESFSQISLFAQMQLLSEVLVEYAKHKLAYIDEFYGDLEAIRAGKKPEHDMHARLNQSTFFNPALIDRLNAVREEMAESIFKAFHVAKADWHRDLDFTSRAMRTELLKNPDAGETHEFLYNKLNYPLADTDVNAMLFLAARGLIYGRMMLEDSTQKDTLERKGLYKQADIDSMLNFLDLLDLKYAYTELADIATALPQSKKRRELEQKLAEFQARVKDLKDNMRDNGELSPVQEQQIDMFIKANASIYLPERLATLPQRIADAQKYISERVLPKPHPAGPDASGPSPQI